MNQLDWQKFCEAAENSQAYLAIYYAKRVFEGILERLENLEDTDAENNLELPTAEKEPVKRATKRTAAKKSAPDIEESE